MGHGHAEAEVALKRCEWCGSDIERTRRWRRFCNTRCRQHWHMDTQRDGVKVNRKQIAETKRILERGVQELEKLLVS
jgi:Uri superfamily endonuclease